MKHKKHVIRTRDNWLILKRQNKRGISVFISWILVILITVSIGTMVYSWIRNYSQQNTDIITQENEQESCDSVALDIVTACQTPNFVYVDLKNQKNLKIEGLSVNLVTLYGKVNNFRVNRTVNIGRTKRFEIPKQGTVKKMIIFPAIIVNNNFIYCVGSEVSIEDIEYC